MTHTCTHLIANVCSVHRLKVDDFCVTKSTIRNKKDCCIRSRCSVDGYDWEIQFRFSPYEGSPEDYWLALVLVYLGAPCDGGVAVALSCHLVDQSCDLRVPLLTTTQGLNTTFRRPLDRSPPIYFGKGKVRDDVQAAAAAGRPLIFKGGSFTVECQIDVHSSRDSDSVSLPSSDLHQHLGELLRNQSGADVTFIVSGESIAAHKSILAARSPIFMAQFFGNMLERGSQCVEIQDMHPAVFKAMLHYIYTDTVPDLGTDTTTVEETAVMAQHLLVAADMYALDRLKEICEERLTRGIGIGTVASTLALADQHNLAQLKAKCIDFITGGSSKNLLAVLETEGYRHLEASNPSVLTELVMAAHGKKRKRLYG
ncbi:BTB/POZ and MATH domain-containing protein 1 [Zea mays]|jgi:speckle-type POZ protein|uniref:BTB/POZ and MATH domain-containing protein 2 n=1 Tax=Zea mays TaxID=4577 RepID=K7TN92_MAIZE|nr:BTB/POZ and MATH domain-containing protein 1 [Zea mays]AQK39937.1 BTB/POZ and MATH domain-containing protein 2 [Zea mays]